MKRKEQSRMSFEQATRTYVHRFTCDHVPHWATVKAPNGRYYAPQYVSDRQWYESTVFPPQNPLHDSDCWSKDQTWPFGTWLDKPYRKGESE